MFQLKFPTSASGRSPVLDAMSNHRTVPSEKHQRAIRKEMRLLEERPLHESIGVNRVEKLQGLKNTTIYELKISAPSNMVYRLLFAVRIESYIALEFFLKKSNNYKKQINIATNRLVKFDNNEYVQ